MLPNSPTGKQMGSIIEASLTIDRGANAALGIGVRDNIDMFMGDCSVRPGGRPTLRPRLTCIGHQRTAARLTKPRGLSVVKRSIRDRRHIRCNRFRLRW